MKGAKLFQSYHAVKFLQNSIKVMNNVIPSIVNMAGIKTNAQLVT